MKEIIVWGLDSTGSYSVLLPVTGQLQNDWNWNGDTKIYHLIGGGVAAYSAGIKTRGVGSLALELRGRSALEQLMECVKYGSFAVGGAQFGGIRYENETGIKGAESLYLCKVCYISGNVSTSVIQESGEWFKVTIPVEIGENTDLIPSMYIVKDSYNGHTPPGQNQLISLYKSGTEYPVGLTAGKVVKTEFSQPGRYLIRETERRFSPIYTNVYGNLIDGMYSISAHFELWQSTTAEALIETLGGSCVLEHVYENGVEVIYTLEDEQWQLSCHKHYNEHTFVVSLMVGSYILRDRYILPVINPEATT